MHRGGIGKYCTYLKRFEVQNFIRKFRHIQVPTYFHDQEN